MIDKSLINFINKHQEWIDNNQWADIYAALYEEYDPKFGTDDEAIGEFTKMMWEAKIDPLTADPTLQYIPEYYLYGQTIGKVDFPSKIVSINSSAFADTNGYSELYIPGHIDCISADAFRGSAVYKVEIDEGCVILGECVFADCDNLKEITIPLSCSIMQDNIFMNSPDVLIRCYRGSRAESYAKEYDIEYEWID